MSGRFARTPRIWFGKVRRERETQRAVDPHHGDKFRITPVTQCLIETFAAQAGFFGEAGHSPGPGDETIGVSDEFGVAGFKGCSDVFDLRFATTKIVGGVKARSSRHSNSSITCCALATSLRWVRLSPPHRIITAVAPRYMK